MEAEGAPGVEIIARAPRRSSPILRSVRAKLSTGVSPPNIILSAILCAAFALYGNLVAGNVTSRAVVATLGSPTLLSSFGSRMFFNLKEAAEHGVNVGTNWASYEPTMGFNEPHSEGNG